MVGHAISPSEGLYGVKRSLGKKMKEREGKYGWVECVLTLRVEAIDIHLKIATRL